MTLSKNLERLATPDDYPGLGKPKVRWGQMIRANATLSEQEQALLESQRLIHFSELGTIRGGVVTRANAYFLVREVPFDQIPVRMKVTIADHRQVAVISDGLDHISKIEREFLRPVIKGPESLESAFSIKRSDVRLFTVRESKKALQDRHANGALAYLRRGETVNFKTSDDDLKGGIPAERSQVKNRKPFWYCLQGEQKKSTRILFPEHIDRRYVFTLVPHRDESVVIDKLYLFEAEQDKNSSFIHAGLNSLFTWYQIELRGRSQLGEGVLELKIPDFAGILLADPKNTTGTAIKKVLQTFADAKGAGSKPSLDELGDVKRYNFDIAYLTACGFKQPEETLIRLEQGLRALAGERTERRLSVSDAKVSRRKITNVAASIDAYAARIVAANSPHPDPRMFSMENWSTELVVITGTVEGDLEIGVELFNQGEVIAGGQCVARASSIQAAQFVKGVLLIEPDLSQVQVPTSKFITKAVADWSKESGKWHKLFQRSLEKTLIGIEDPRTRSSVEQRALKLLHAV